MKKLFASLITALVMISGAHAAGGALTLDKFPKERLTNVAALQNGAKLFVNYCLNCHSAAFMRYNRLTDIGLTVEQIKDNLLFTTEKVGDNMVAAIDPKEAKQWFGANPPDLTVIARSRAAAGQGSGADYLYTYLRTYYPDATKPTGWNNLAFPNVGMPHVLWQLQGSRIPVYETKEEHGHEVHVFKNWQQVTPGSMSTLEYDNAVGDLVSYLQWMGEPSQNTRKRVGVGVLLFLAVLTVFTWRLNASYWKEIK